MVCSTFLSFTTKRHYYFLMTKQTYDESEIIDKIWGETNGIHFEIKLQYID